MPRAQDILLGVVLWISSLIMLQAVGEKFDSGPTSTLHSGMLSDFGFFDRIDFVNKDWSREELATLERLMDDHVIRFRTELEEYNFSSRSRRSERATVRIPTVTATNHMSKTSLNATANQLESQGAISCFVWNGERFCILGGTIFVFRSGKVEPFLSGLPIGINDHVKTYVYDDVIFLTIYDKISLRLYLLQSPGWMTLVSIQHITGEVLEDCAFFEHEGTLYMALVIQLGTLQFSTNSGMQCIIYEWLGTTMDMKHAFAAPELRKVGILQSSDTVHLVLIHTDSSIHLRQFTDAEETELLEIINTGLDRVYQFDTFLTESQWCILLAGSNSSYIYCLQEERLLQWQVLLHNQTTSTVSWMRIQQEGISGSYESTILIFNAFDSQSHFQFYASDTSGHFHHVFGSPKHSLDGRPIATLALLDGPSSAHVYVAVANQDRFFLETFAIRMSEEFREEPEIDPLLQCLSDVDLLISSRDAGTLHHAEELKNNIVHFKDNVTTNGTVVIAQMNYTLSPVIGTVKILYNFSQEFQKPEVLENALKGLEMAAKNLMDELPDLLYSTNSTFTGRLRLNGTVVTADDVRIGEASIKNLNGRDWDEFSQQAWRYSWPEHIFLHDMRIEDLEAETISVNSTIGGSLASRWLLKSGGKINGSADLASFDVRGNIDLGNHSINGVAVTDTLPKNTSNLVIQGVKLFSTIEVKNDVSVDSINERDFKAWSKTLILQKSEEEQHFTGSVRIKGHVQVVESFRSDWINRINVSTLPELLVDKNAHQIVEGFVNFTGPLFVDDAEVDSLSGHLIEDLLSSSGRQIIQAPIDVDVLDIQGNIDCPDINGRNVNDFVYTDESDTQVVLGRVQFSNDLIVRNLVMEDGSLNGLDVVTLLDPPSLRIDSKIQTNGDLAAHAAHVQWINNINLSKLSKNYWTKSTDQSIDVNVRMPFNIVIKENVTTRTFMEKFLDRDFFLTKANQTINVEVEFTDDVAIHGDLMIHDLKDINGVTLVSLDEDVVKKEGDFHVFGSKTFEQLIIHGNLAVDDTFNNLNIPQDIALLNRSQTLSGMLFASDVTVDDDVISSTGDITLNTVAGVLLDDFVAIAATIDEDAIISGDIHFKRYIEVDDLVVNSLLNDRNVNDVVSKGMRRNNSDFLRWPGTTIYGDVTFKDSLDTVTINSYNVEEYLSRVVNMSDPQIITGTKKASRPITVEQDVIFGLFNDVHLDFSTMLTISDSQTITGDYVFDHLQSKRIDLRAINGQNLSDFVQIAGTSDVQAISGPMNFQHVTVENSLRIENHVLNGCNLTEYLEVTEFSHFDSLSIQNGSLLMDQPLETNPDLAIISLKALRNDRAQVVTGHVSFLSDVLMETLNLSNNRLGSVNLEQLLHGSMRKSAVQDIEGPIKYLNGIQVESVDHVGHLNFTNWNGKNVMQMVNDVVLKTGNQTVAAKKTFFTDWEIQGNLNITGNIDDVPVASLVKVNESRLPSQTKFTSLVVKEQLNVTNGMIDGVNITSVLQQRVPLRGNSTIKSNIIFKDLVTTDNFSVKEINSLNMSDIAWKTLAPGQVFSGKKHLNGTLDIQGDITVDFLNGRNPEENTAFVVLKDEDGYFQHPVSFDGGLTVLKNVTIKNYNEMNMDQLIANASTGIILPEIEPKILHEQTPALQLLLSLQQSKGKLSSFEFFEQIQQITFSFPHSSNYSMQIQQCPIPTRKQSSTSDTTAGILVATHSTDGNSCNLKKLCRCHHSVTLPSDTNGYVNTLRIPTRLKDYLEESLIHGDRVRLLHSRDQLFVLTIESLSSCLAEKMTIAVFNPLTFKLLKETVFEVDDTIVDAAVEQKNDDVVILAISQKSAGVWIFSFDGDSFQRLQLIETEAVASIHMSSHKKRMFLAIASYGLEAVSSIWSANSFGKFELIKDVITVGATDVLFTKSHDDMHVTFAQDPSSIDPYSDSWSQFKVPAQVLLYIPSFGSFEVIQQLDIDRIVSLANLFIDGDPFMAVATFTGKVRVYRLIQGQGFKVEQTFKYPGVRSITGYSIRNETYLAAATESRMAIFVARLRGFQKPSVEL